MKQRLSIDRCPIHSDFWAISLTDECSGERLTPSKCCGQWHSVKTWNLSERDWLRISAVALQQAELAKGEGLAQP